SRLEFHDEHLGLCEKQEHDLQTEHWPGSSHYQCVQRGERISASAGGQRGQFVQKSQSGWSLRGLARRRYRELEGGTGSTGGRGHPGRWRSALDGGPCFRRKRGPILSPRRGLCSQVLTLRAGAARFRVTPSGGLWRTTTFSIQTHACPSSREPATRCPR